MPHPRVDLRRLLVASLLLPMAVRRWEAPMGCHQRKVNEVVNRLVAAASPLRLVAFGSAARGDLAIANVLDLLVDLVVTGQAFYNERCRIPGTVEFTAAREGLVLHDSL